MSYLKLLRSFYVLFWIKIAENMLPHVIADLIYLYGKLHLNRLSYLTVSAINAWANELRWSTEKSLIFLHWNFGSNITW